MSLSRRERPTDRPGSQPGRNRPTSGGRGRIGDGDSVALTNKEHNVHKRKIAAVAIAMSLVVAACGGDDDSSEAHR